MTFKIQKEKKEKGIIKLNVSVNFSEIENKKEKTLEKLSKNIEIEGFRKGKAPKEVVLEKLGDSKILEEASQEVINEIFPKILEKEKLQIIGYPSISVTKLAPGNDFEFIVEMAVYPEVSLPEYKKIGKDIKKKVEKVGEKEIKKVEENLINMQNQMFDQGENSAEPKESKKEVKELTDEFVKQLGPFERVSDFKKKLKEDLKKEAEKRAVVNHRGEIAEAILKNTNFDIPEILINAELDKIIAQMKDDILKNGQNFEEYLKKQNKTEMNLREDFKKEAEKRAKIEIILKEIAKIEKISPNNEEVDKQVKLIMKTYKDANIENVSLYVKNIIINEEVMKFLEKLSS